jgi:hypothetical protein
MHPVLKPPDILADTLATNAGVHLYIEEFTNCQHYSLSLRSKLPSRRDNQCLHPTILFVVKTKQGNVILISKSRL